MRRFSSSFRWLFFAVLACISLFLTLRIHRDTGRFNWQSEIYADGAGYYAYLPVTFLYRLDYDNFPAGINDSTGCSFVDHQNKKFVYKYTCGVAALISPFFAATVFVSKLAGIPLQGGFSDAFHRMVDVAAVFYLVLGLFFTGEVLKKYTSVLVRYSVLIFIYAGTNLYFYALRQPLMSHVYSFFIIGLFLYALQRFLDKQTSRTFILVAVAASLAILIRPVNGIILVLLPFWDTGSLQAVKERIKILFAVRNMVTFLAVFLIVFLPQMLYWQYMFGTPVHYAYGRESFSNWAAPRFAEIWFAPLNGLFLYNPLWFVFIAGMMWMILSGARNGILLLLVFLLTSYIISAWHSWFFGCGYGHRAFIDFLPVFAIPFAVITERIFRIRIRIPAATMAIILTAMSYYNIRIIYAYSGCFTGSVWDWQRFDRLLFTAGFGKAQGPVFVFKNDFENGILSPESLQNDSISRSFLKSIKLDDNHVRGGGSPLYFFQFALPFPTHADASVYVYFPAGRTSGGTMHCRIERKGKILFSDSCALDPFITAPEQWCMVYKTFTFAPDMPWDATVSVELENQGGSVFFADDLKVVFH